MAFTYKDPVTGKAVFDVAEANIQVRSPDGLTVVDLVVDGKIATAVLPSPAVPYTDAKAVAALKAKPAIVALSAASTLEQIVAALKA